VGTCNGNPSGIRVVSPDVNAPLEIALIGSGDCTSWFVGD
jgi:hypothetical protein